MSDNPHPVGALVLRDDKTAKAWPLFSADTPEAFYRRMTAGLPQGTQLKLTLNSKGQLNYLEYNYRGEGEEFFKFNINSRDGSYLSFENGDVYPQGNGISKIVNGHLFRLYQETGVEKVHVMAIDIGSFAWGRLGFVPIPEYWHDLKININRRLDFLVHNTMPQDSLSPAYIKALRAAAASDDPKSFWFIVDQEYACRGTSLGKLLTMHLLDLPKKVSREMQEAGLPNSCNWKGAIDMNDPDCIGRFKAYLHPAKTRKPSLQKKPTMGARP